MAAGISEDFTQGFARIASTIYTGGASCRIKRRGKGREGEERRGEERRGEERRGEESGPDFHFAGHVLGEGYGARPHLDPVGDIVRCPPSNFLACHVEGFDLVTRSPNLDLQAALVKVNHSRFLRWGAKAVKNGESEPMWAYFPRACVQFHDLWWMGEGSGMFGGKCRFRCCS
jgi:hypothetical protein